jgi:hypothetical protein
VVVGQQTQDVLLDAKVVGGLRGVVAYPHSLQPLPISSDHGEVARSIEPFVQSYAFAQLTRLANSCPAIVAILRFIEQFVGSGSISGHHTAQSADFADMPHQRARVNVPDRQESCGDSNTGVPFLLSASSTRICENSRTTSDSM